MAEVTWERVADDEDTKTKQRLLAERMLADGLIDHIPQRGAESDYQRHPPIIVQGRPVSETLLEDREPHWNLTEE